MDYNLHSVQYVEYKIKQANYKNRVEELTANIGTAPNEMYVLHATADSNVQSIVMNGLSFVKGLGPNARSLFGYGIYVGTQLGYVAQDHFAAINTLNGKKHKTILIFRVAIANVTLGTERTSHSIWKNGILHDAMVDELQYPRMYVLHDANQACLEYIVRFKEE